MKNIWKKIKKPFFVLAPMAEVTDVVFREFVSRHSKPDLFYTEFVSCKGLLHEEGRKKLVRDLQYTDRQRPIIAQVFGNEPDEFYASAKLIKDLGFDGMDINMGCPVKKVQKQGVGAMLIKEPELAKNIVQASKEGAGDMPISVKTRLGYDEIETNTWIQGILQQEPAALIVHGRTKKEMSKVPAHWDEIAKVAEMAKASDIVIVGNGDVKSREQGEGLAQETGVDGIMIGRGVFGNPWVFDRSDENLDRASVEKMQALMELAWMFEDHWGRLKNFSILKKHVGSYVSNFQGAKEVREQMMSTTCVLQMEEIIQKTIEGKGGKYLRSKRGPITLASVFDQEQV